MAKSKISWTQKVWSFNTGCDKCSPGCKNCYAERMSKRLQTIPQSAYKYRNGFEFTMHHDELETPFRWRKPSMVFVNSMSDTFHEKMDSGFLRETFGAMTHLKRHMFQVLTKRPYNIPSWIEWPENVWLGVTVCNQKEADEKVPLLLRVPAAVRFLSIEPMLESVDIAVTTYWDDPSAGVHWVIVGGESGPGARPMDMKWAESIRQECIKSGIPFFFKQRGGKHGHGGDLLENGLKHQEYPKAYYEWIERQE